MKRRLMGPLPSLTASRSFHCFLAKQHAVVQHAISSSPPAHPPAIAPMSTPLTSESLSFEGGNQGSGVCVAPAFARVEESRLRSIPPPSPPAPSPPSPLAPPAPFPSAPESVPLGSGVEVDVASAKPSEAEDDILPCSGAYVDVVAPVVTTSAAASVAVELGPSEDRTVGRAEESARRTAVEDAEGTIVGYAESCGAAGPDNGFVGLGAGIYAVEVSVCVRLGGGASVTVICRKRAAVAHAPRASVGNCNR